MVTVYSKDNCPACEQLKQLLAATGTEYVEMKIGRDISREDFMEKFPGVRTVPHMVKENE